MDMCDEVTTSAGVQDGMVRETRFYLHFIPTMKRGRITIFDPILQHLYIAVRIFEVHLS